MNSVQAWTFNRVSVLEATTKAAQAGARYMEFYPGQRLGGDLMGNMGPEMGNEAIAKLKAHLQASGVTAAAFGVVDIPQDPERARRLFRWAKGMGIGILNTESVNSMDTIEMMVKEFDIKVGFHNHPRNPRDANYRVWDPNYVLSIVKNRDRRIGACADTGHWVRSGIKPIDALRILRGRIVSSHLKDLNVMEPSGYDIVFGTGVSDIPAILKELMRQGFKGTLSVEYERWSPNLEVEVGQCVGFLYGFFAGR
jgi:sugar phosphate isomerase/epimerase